MLNSLGFDRDPKDTRVVVAMSGGVDSSVVAALLAEEGYDVIGITLQLYDYGKVAQRKGSCCAGQDIYDAAQVAERIGIPHYVFDYEDKFKQGVIDEFVESYMAGETPVPCIKCNQTVKFRDLLKAAKELNADALATGHYVQRIVGESSGQAELHRGVDPVRDQSYFLFATTQDQLEYLRFPLGGMPKSETRRHAERFGLQVADKPDSQDICFVPDGNYAKVIERFYPGALDAGDIVDLEGHILGRHEGIINFTVGQRKGLGISAPFPLYVIRVNAHEKQVVVGPKEALARRIISLKDVNWLASREEALSGGMDVTVKIRSSGHELPAVIHLEEGDRAQVELLTPEYGISPGQACVFYEGMRALGGGWIV